VRDVPDNYLPVASGTGAAKSAELVIAPASIDGRAYGVVELGFFGKVDAAKPELLHRIAEPLAAAIRASKDRMRLEELLQETQVQAEELQTREEELRVNNEELEEQSRRCANRARSSNRSRRSSSRSTSSSRNRRRPSSIRRMRSSSRTPS